MRALLDRGAPTPRAILTQNIADLKAQVAANEKGAAELRNIVRHYGLAVVAAYMGHVQDNAAEGVSRVIATLKTQHFEVETDQGNVIKVAIKIDRKARSAVVDFTGTSAQPPTISTRPSRSRALACSMCSARWSTRTSR